MIIYEANTLQHKPQPHPLRPSTILTPPPPNHRHRIPATIPVPALGRHRPISNTLNTPPRLILPTPSHSPLLTPSLSTVRPHRSSHRPLPLTAPDSPPLRPPPPPWVTHPTNFSVLGDLIFVIHKFLTNIYIYIFKRLSIYYVTIFWAILDPPPPSPKRHLPAYTLHVTS
jgi:hypothetical protein